MGSVIRYVAIWIGGPDDGAEVEVGRTDRTCTVEFEVTPSGLEGDVKKVEITAKIEKNELGIRHLIWTPEMQSQL